MGNAWINPYMIFDEYYRTNFLFFFREEYIWLKLKQLEEQSYQMLQIKIDAIAPAKHSDQGCSKTYVKHKTTLL